MSKVHTEKVIVTYHSLADCVSQIAGMLYVIYLLLFNQKQNTLAVDVMKFMWRYYRILFGCYEMLKLANQATTLHLPIMSADVLNVLPPYRYDHFFIDNIVHSLPSVPVHWDTCVQT